MNEQSTAQRYVLPSNVIDKLFLRLESAYGSRWMNMWGNASLADVKSLWAEKLGGFHDNLSAIGYALDALDEHPFPPTLPEFLALCRKAPRPERVALPAPAPNLEKVAEFAGNAKAATQSKTDPHSWAKRPKSAIAFHGLLNLVAQGDSQFEEILQSLREAGHVVGNALVHRWENGQWVKA